MKISLYLLCLLTVASTAFAKPSPIVARSGAVELTAADVRASVAGLDADKQAALESDATALERHVRALLVERLVLREAEASGHDKRPEVIARLVRARESVLAETWLADGSAVAPSYPTDDEIAEAYDMAKPQLKVPRSYRLAQIYISKDKAKLDKTVQQLKAKGADFAAIAREASEESATAAQGGEIGWLTADQVQPELREKLPELRTGVTTDPIHLEDGWHILRVLDIREPHTPTLDQVRPQLLAQLRLERARQNRAEVLERLLEKNPVAINQIELSNLTATPAAISRR